MLRDALIFNQGSFPSLFSSVLENFFDQGSCKNVPVILGNAGVPSKNFLGLNSSVVLVIGAETFTADPKFPNHQFPSLPTKKLSAYRSTNN